MSYEDEFDDWLLSLSPAERMELEKKGFDKPLREKGGAVNTSEEEEGEDYCPNPTLPESPDSLQDFIAEASAEFVQVNELPTSKEQFRQHVLEVLERSLALAYGVQSIDEVVGLYTRAKGNQYADALKQVLAEIVTSSNPIYFCDVIAYAIGSSIRAGISGAEIAKKHGISRQAFLNKAEQFQERFGLPKTQAQKSAEASKIYQYNKRNNKSCN